MKHLIDILDLTTEEIDELIVTANDIAANPENTEQIIAATPDSAIWIMKIAMMILPLICILIGFVLYMKKFKIDEKMYADILADLNARESLAAGNEEGEKESVAATNESADEV